MEIVDQVKEIVALVKKMNNMPLLKKVVALEADILALQQENLGLKKSMSQLQEKLDLKASMIYEKPFCWKVEGDRREGPYCPKCWESEGKPIHLKEAPRSVSGGSSSNNVGSDLWICPRCNGSHRGPRYTPPPPPEPYDPLTHGRV